MFQFKVIRNITLQHYLDACLKEKPKKKLSETSKKPSDSTWKFWKRILKR
ncbi:hypothetical protein [Thermococcus barophilus]